MVALFYDLSLLQIDWKLINAKKTKKKNYDNSGTIRLESIKVSKFEMNIIYLSPFLSSVFYFRSVEHTHSLST